MAVNLSALAGAGQQFFDNNGTPLSGGKLYSYAAGTTTPQTTYTSVSGSTPLANPIILDSAGRVPTGEIWLTAGSNYKFVLKTSVDVTLATWDNITGINGTGITSNAVNVQYDPAGIGAVATTVQTKLRETVSVKDFGAVGDGVTDDTLAIQAAVDHCVANEKKLFLPAGNYLITSSLNLTYAPATSGGSTTLYQGIVIEGEGYPHSVIVGKTSGFPIIDMTGSRLCVFRNFAVVYNNNDAFTPSCGFLMSRNLFNGGAGEHTFENVQAYGYFIKAAIAELSSELNGFYNIRAVNFHPAGHGFYTSGTNTVGITSAYIAGLDTHSFSGGNTRHAYYNCRFYNFATTDSGGQSLYIESAVASPTDNLLFSGCYTVAEPNSKASSITIAGNCRGLTFENFRDESNTTHAFLITSGSTVSNFTLKDSFLEENVYGEDTSILQTSEISNSYIATTHPDGGLYLAVDLYGFRYSKASGALSGVRIRDDVTCTVIDSSNMNTNSLVLSSTGSKKHGVEYVLRNPSTLSAYKYFQGDIGGANGFTGMTTGFMYMPAGNGAPVGTPENTFTGRVPFYYDATNNKFYVYNGGTWRGVTLT